MEGTGPRSHLSRDELDPDLDVHVEIIGDDLETGYTVIHDPDYVEPPGEYVEMELTEALSEDATFCCDCFETAWIETIVDE